MAAGFLIGARDALAARLATVAGLRVVTDPRNVSPWCILVGAPRGRMFTGQVADITFPATLIGSGPGNQDALDELLTILATILDSNSGITDWVPTTYSDDSTVAPAYDLTCRVAATQ